jgi:hypothetical protein
MFSQDGQTGPDAPGVSGSGTDLRQRLLQKYAKRGLLVLTVVDVNVDDAIVALFEVRPLLHLMRTRRTWRNTGKLLFVRKVNRMSMRATGGLLPHGSGTRRTWTRTGSTSPSLW